MFKNLLTLSPFDRGRPSLFVIIIIIFFSFLERKRDARVQACVCAQGKPLIRFVPSSFRELVSII